jgi:hypothetical protein
MDQSTAPEIAVATEPSAAPEETIESPAHGLSLSEEELRARAKRNCKLCNGRGKVLRVGVGESVCGCVLRELDRDLRAARSVAHAISVPATVAQPKVSASFADRCTRRTAQLQAALAPLHDDLSSRSRKLEAKVAGMHEDLRKLAALIQERSEEMGTLALQFEECIEEEAKLTKRLAEVQARAADLQIKHSVCEARGDDALAEVAAVMGAIAQIEKRFERDTDGLRARIEKLERRKRLAQAGCQ